MAEGVGFEPTRPVRVCQFSRLVPSTARPPFHFANYTLVTLDWLPIPANTMEMRTTQRKGDIAVSQAIATFTKLGYDVSLPVTESAPYDLVVDTGTVLAKVQSKYSSEKDVDLRMIHSNSQGYVVKKASKKSYDWLYILKSNGKEYLLKQCFDERRSIRPTESSRINF